MLTDTIRDYYAYAEWANARVLDQAQHLRDDQYFESDLDHVWPIHDTLVHIMSGQDVWLRRWNGEQKVGLANPHDFADLAAVRSSWDLVDDRTRAFLDGLTDEALASDSSITNYKGEPFTNSLWKQMLHQCNHQTYHRGEVAALLSRFGYSPGEIDYSRYFYARD